MLKGIDNDIGKPRDMEKKDKYAAVSMCLKLGNSYEAIGKVIYPKSMTIDSGSYNFFAKYNC